VGKQLVLVSKPTRAFTLGLRLWYSCAAFVRISNRFTYGSEKEIRAFFGWTFRQPASAIDTHSFYTFRAVGLWASPTKAYNDGSFSPGKSKITRPPPMDFDVETTLDDPERPGFVVEPSRWEIWSTESKKKHLPIWIPRQRYSSCISVSIRLHFGLIAWLVKESLNPRAR